MYLLGVLEKDGEDEFVARLKFPAKHVSRDIGDSWNVGYEFRCIQGVAYVECDFSSYYS